MERIEFARKGDVWLLAHRDDTALYTIFEISANEYTEAGAAALAAELFPHLPVLRIADPLPDTSWI